MNIIRIYCDEFDLYNKNLIHYFVRYAGFYVEEMFIDREQVSENEHSSVADIYVVGREYIRGHNGVLTLDWDEGTILMLMDGMELTEQDEDLICIYQKSNRFDSKLLCRLARELAVVIERKGLTGNGQLTGSVQNLSETLSFLAQEYMKYDIMPLCLYARCFYAKDELWRFARQAFGAFITALQTDENPGCMSDLNLYTVSYAMYEMNAVCKKNHYVFCYPVEKLCADVLYLCTKYPENEQIHLLYADILMELKEDWVLAANEYLDEHVMHCAYALYRHGRIRRKFAKDSESALKVLRAAVSYKRDYFGAWYQIGMCHEMQYDYRKAILAYEKVYQILKKKYDRDILSPLELEYLYKTVVKLEHLHRSIHNDREAEVYKKEAGVLQADEPEKMNYQMEVWPNMPLNIRQKIMEWAADAMKWENICGS